MTTWSQDCWPENKAKREELGKSSVKPQAGITAEERLKKIAVVKSE
jgi:hypothetical protein